MSSAQETVCLVTGVDGLLGFHLADAMADKGLSVFGTFHRSTRHANHLNGKITLLPCDFQDGNRVEAVVAQAQPRFVFHLAAQSFPSFSWKDPEATFKTNVLGSMYVLEAVRAVAADATVIMAGSSAEYSFSNSDRSPAGENRPLQPRSPYGVSKVAADLLGRVYAQTYGLKVVCVRPFSVIGPRKEGDVSSDFARGIVAVERGERTGLEVGNLLGVRDFVDVRDAVDACWLLAQRGEPGEAYNLCSGIGHSIQELLDILMAAAKRPIPIEHRGGREGHVDEPPVVGDAAKLRALGWTPRISLERSLESILEFWRNEP